MPFVQLQNIRVAQPVNLQCSSSGTCWTTARAMSCAIAQGTSGGPAKAQERRQTEAKPANEARGGQRQLLKKMLHLGSGRRSLICK